MSKELESSKAVKPIMVKTSEAARLLGLSPQTLRNWRNAGKGPKYVHISSDRSPALYRYEDLVAWANSLDSDDVTEEHAQCVPESGPKC